MEERAIRESKGIDVEKRVDRRVEKEETVATLEAHRSLKWPRLIRYSLFPLLGHRYRDCRSVTRTYFPLLHLHRSCSCRMHNESLVFSGTRERGWSPPLATRVFSSFIVSVVATGLPRWSRPSPTGDYSGVMAGNSFQSIDRDEWALQPASSTEKGHLYTRTIGSNRREGTRLWYIRLRSFISAAWISKASSNTSGSNSNVPWEWPWHRSCQRLIAAALNAPESGK